MDQKDYSEDESLDEHAMQELRTRLISPNEGIITNHMFNCMIHNHADLHSRSHPLSSAYRCDVRGFGGSTVDYVLAAISRYMSSTLHCILFDHATSTMEGIPPHTVITINHILINHNGSLTPYQEVLEYYLGMQPLRSCDIATVAMDYTRACPELVIMRHGEIDVPLTSDDWTTVYASSQANCVPIALCDAESLVELGISEVNATSYCDSEPRFRVSFMTRPSEWAPNPDYGYERLVCLPRYKQLYPTREPSDAPSKLREDWKDTPGYCEHTCGYYCDFSKYDDWNKEDYAHEFSVEVPTSPYTDAPYCSLYNTCRPLALLSRKYAYRLTQDGTRYVCSTCRLDLVMAIRANEVMKIVRPQLNSDAMGIIFEFWTGLKNHQVPYLSQDIMSPPRSNTSAHEKFQKHVVDKWTSDIRRDLHHYVNRRHRTRGDASVMKHHVNALCQWAKMVATDAAPKIPLVKSKQQCKRDNTKWYRTYTHRIQAALDACRFKEEGGLCEPAGTQVLSDMLLRATNKGTADIHAQLGTTAYTYSSLLKRTRDRERDYLRRLRIQKMRLKEAQLDGRKEATSS